jgi:hypothetical protein
VVVVAAGWDGRRLGGGSWGGAIIYRENGNMMKVFNDEPWK